MKTKDSSVSINPIHWLALLAVWALPAICAAQGTAFNYQGRLNDGSGPANGLYDLRFALFQAASGQNSVGGPVTNTATAVSNGSFSVTIDFGGGVFNGADRWLELQVRTNGNGSFALLNPRQQLLPQPYAIFAGNAAASASYTGPIATSQLPASVALLNGNQTFSGAVSFTNGANYFGGNGAGLNGVPWTSLNGEAIESSSYGNYALTSTTMAVPGVQAYGVADLNGDHYPDVVTVGTGDFSGDVLVFTNNHAGGYGTLTNISFGTPNAVVPVSTVLADFNGDGSTDIAVGIAGSGSDTNINFRIEIWTNNGTGTFSFASAPFLNYFSADTMIAADVNGDNKTDIIADTGFFLMVLTNDGAGNFNVTSVQSTIGSLAGAAVADVNGDHRPDLIVKQQYNTLKVYTNNGTGAFGYSSTLTVGIYPNQVATMDVNNDGKPDLICANSWADTNYTSSTMSVFTNDGQGGFALSSTLVLPEGPAVVKAVAPADVNGDGRLDLVASDYYDAALSLWTNNGAGGFGFHGYAYVGSDADQLVIADVNNDGRPDMVTENLAGNFLSTIVDVPTITFMAPMTVQSNMVVQGAAILMNNANVLAGNGAALTGLNAGSIASGTLDDARLSANVALLNRDGQYFAGTNIFNGTVAITNPATVLSFGNTSRQMVNLWGPQYGIGIQSYTLYFRTDDSFPGADFAWFQGGVHNPNKLNPGGGKTLMVLDNTGSLWVTNKVYAAGVMLTSDRNSKAGFEPVDTRDLLDKLVSLPITRWHYTNDTATPHVGPVAQDFSSAFGVGSDDKHISVVDEGGVALAAIQGLNRKLEDELHRLNSENEELRAQNESLEKRMEALEKTVTKERAN